jgi:hypothetical protein
MTGIVIREVLFEKGQGHVMQPWPVRSRLRLFEQYEAARQGRCAK